MEIRGHHTDLPSAPGTRAVPSRGARACLRIRLQCVALSLALAGCATARSASQPSSDHVAATLDAWHAAAARADEAAYFALFTPDAVYVGTDPAERWTRDAFRAWAHPYFARGKAWSFKPTRRAVTVHGDVAWFDEDIPDAALGPLRGSGVAVRTPEGWRIAHYVPSFMIPNDSSAAVRGLIRK